MGLFVTGGDPELDQLPAILTALVDGGADFIEIGLPFSDPIADGPTIQASSQRALDRGVRPKDVLCAVADWNDGQVPLVAMGYANTALQCGLHNFARQLADAGINGCILSDLPPDEADEWSKACDEFKICPIFLAAPTSTDDRLAMVCQQTKGFIYAVSRTGVTGANAQTSGDSHELVRRLRSQTSTPIFVGFGISTPEHVKAVCEIADGAIIGSWLVDKLASEWKDGAGREALVSAICEFKKATRKQP